MHKWDYRFNNIAKEVASWSKDPSTQIGVIVVNPNTRAILSSGFNGLPRNIEDTPERLNNREEKYKYIIHGEMNAIYNAAKNGVNLEGSTFYVWGLPVCSQCALALSQTGISRVVIEKVFIESAPDKWTDSWKLSKEILQESGIEITLI